MILDGEKEWINAQFDFITINPFYLIQDFFIFYFDERERERFLQTFSNWFAKFRVFDGREREMNRIKFYMLEDIMNLGNLMYMQLNRIGFGVSETLAESLGGEN